MTPQLMDHLVAGLKTLHDLIGEPTLLLFGFVAKQVEIAPPMRRRDGLNDSELLELP